MEKVSAEEWQAAIRLAIRQEDLYIEIDQDQPSPSLMPEDIEPAVEQEIAATEHEKEVLKCENCDYETEIPAHFQNHKGSIIFCEHCSKCFCGKRAQRMLKTHLKEHDFKPKNAHICEICKKPFKNATLLKNHKIRSKCGRQ